MRVIERGASEREFGGIRRKLKISWWKLLTQSKCIYIYNEHVSYIQLNFIPYKYLILDYIYI